MPPIHAKKPCSDCMFADGGKCEKHLLKMADGGEMESKEMAGPAEGDEMGDTLADELMDAFERKDKRAVKDAIEALVMECMNKGGM